MRAFYADERVDGKIWDLSNPFYKIIYRFFKKKENVDINITVNVGKTFLAGEKVFEILKYYITILRMFYE